MRVATIDITIAEMHHFPMRTTFSIDDEILEQVRRYAEERSMPMGEAVTELIRKAFRTPTPTKMVNGLCVFDLPPDSPQISNERVKELEAEDE